MMHACTHMRTPHTLYTWSTLSETSSASVKEFTVQQRDDTFVFDKINMKNVITFV